MQNKTVLPSVLLRLLAGTVPFTIVSNNCWGAHVYKALDIAYRTPFVGLFVPPYSFIVLLRQFDHYMKSPLTFVGGSLYPHINAWRLREGLNYPIALLGDEIEINFQHYKNAAEAEEKWTRRCARMVTNPARQYFKFDDREGATAEDIAAFAALDFPRKVCFTARPYSVHTVLIPSAKGDEHVADGASLARISPRYFNTLRWISSLPNFMPLPALL